MSLMTRATFMGAIVLLGASVFGFLVVSTTHATPQQVIISDICVGAGSTPGTDHRRFVEDVVPIEAGLPKAREACDDDADDNSCVAGALRPPRDDEVSWSQCPGWPAGHVFFNAWLCLGVGCT